MTGARNRGSLAGWFTGVRWWRLLPGVVALVSAVLVLRATGVSVGLQGRYLLALLWSVQIPGMLLVRAALGRPRHLVTDVGLGFVAGLAVQLLGWAAFTALGVGQWQVLWPLAVIAVFAAVPTLRRAFTLAPYDAAVGTVTAWAAAAVGVAVGFASCHRTSHRTRTRRCSGRTRPRSTTRRRQ